ncbi:sarcosine oxidase subunit gamma [Nesterenkonia lutea]|uniref:Sarcosine oxidase subunit gamma n=1 Tax=Nesterenkonia lutea TaxID=272919 RepID=A0ABR9JG57_9MICC|nr:sarcosine oxidase subunit gamma family protein [Nesterenkonia lutea]MBE1524911.1 sarcosine oxidase subunit gamma [Nesterenkonia lutea]
MAEDTATLQSMTSSTGTIAISEELAALRRAPAAHLWERMAAAEVNGSRSVALREIAFPTQRGVRVKPGSESARRVEQRLGITLPDRRGNTTGDADGLHAMWLSPDEYLVVDVSREQIPGEVEQEAAALEGLPGQILDLSANRAVLELSGSCAREVLEKGCHIDLHPREFPISAAVSTLLGPVPVILHRSGESSYRVLPRSSFATFTVLWLLDAMTEYSSEQVL